MITYTLDNIVVDIDADGKRFLIAFDIMRNGEFLQRIEMSFSTNDTYRVIFSSINKTLEQIAIEHEAREHLANMLASRLEEIEYVYNRSEINE